MRISDFSLDANTIEQQVADVKAYATANYNKHGWDVVIETMTDADLAGVIGKRKNTRAAINAVYAHIQPFHERRTEAMANAKIEQEAANGPAPIAEPVTAIDPKGVGDQSPEAVRRARRTAQQKARREAARAAKA